MKAVIMAGGKGERLYPLTAETPKPMMRISGRPILEYILALLEKNGFDDVTITIGYRGEQIEKCFGKNYGNIKIKYQSETKPLGTAGSVKKAASKWKEPFLVISGDAMCDFDLKLLMRYHKETGAAVTIASYVVDDPREYGILVTDNQNRVVSFLEKPGWNQAITDRINTGIYVMNPEVLRYAEEGEYCDFSKQIFPILIQNGYPVFSLSMEGYWRDIGNVNAFRQCQKDMLDSMIHLPSAMMNSVELPAGNYRILPPCYVSADADIGDHAIIGPYAVIDGECKIGAESRIEDSVIGSRTDVGKCASIYHSVIDCDCIINSGARVLHESVLGKGAMVGKDAVIQPYSVIAPKYVADGRISSQEITDSTEKRYAIDSPWFLSRYTYALGLTRSGRRVALCYERSPISVSLVYAAKAGFSSSDCTLLEFPDSFCAETMYLTVKYGTGVGIHISESGTVTVFSQGGLPLDSQTKKEISKSMTDCNKLTIKGISKQYLQSEGNNLYREYLSSAFSGVFNLIKINSDNTLITEMINYIMGARISNSNNKVIFSVSNGGLSLKAEDEKGRVVSHEALLSLCCDSLIADSQNVALPFAAPVVLQNTDGSNGKMLRYLSESDGITDEEARRLASRQLFLRDGLLLAAWISGVMAQTRKPLSELIEPYLNNGYKSKRIQLAVRPTQICTVLDVIPMWNEVGEGVAVNFNNASAVIIPDETGFFANVFAKGNSMEAAAELTADIERKIGRTDE